METESVEYYEIVEESIEQVPVILNDSPIHQIPRRVVESNLAFWAVIDGVLLVFILSGNILTILAVRFSRRLRSVISNMFVLSLAISDMVVGFTLPYHLAFYMKSGLGQSHGWCLLRFFLIILACCVSIWNLIAIAVDRYIAIVYPLHYSRYVTKKVALILLSFGWFVGAAFALIPMFWNNWETATQCEFDEILPKWYMAGVITPGFSMVWVCMLIVYWRIWREASKQARQLRSSFTGLHESPSDWKSVQVVLFILGCFSICWLPYFIIACAQIFKFLEKSSPMLYKGAFSLAMANSGMNPIIYAWKNSSFRRAFARLLRCKSPDHIDLSQHSTRSNMHRKSSSLHPQDTLNATISCTPPQSAVNGNFNEFNDITSTGKEGGYIGSNSNSNNSSNGDVRKYNGTRRVSLALIHTTPPETIKFATVKGTGEIFAEKGGANVGKGTVTTSASIPTQVILTNGTTASSAATVATTTIPITKTITTMQQNPCSDHQKIISSDIQYMVKRGIKTHHSLINDLNGGGKSLVIKQIECDGNGNTQIRILNAGSDINKMRQLQQQQEQHHIKNHHSIASSANMEFPKGQKHGNGETFNEISFNSRSKQVLNRRYPIVEQLSNGNHIISNLKRSSCGSQIV